MSHKVFLRHLFGFGHEKGDLGKQPRCVEYADRGVEGFMRDYFDNAECRSVVARFGGGEGG